MRRARWPRRPSTAWRPTPWPAPAAPIFWRACCKPPATTTDQALTQLRQRLRQRVQQQAAPARLARRPRRHRWLGPQLATAAALLLGLLAGGWWAWQQRQLAAGRVASASHASQPAPAPAASRQPPAPTPPVAARPEPTPPGAASPAKVAARRQGAPAHTRPQRVAATPVLAAPSTETLAAAPADSGGYLATAREAALPAPTPPAAAKASAAAARLRAALPPPPALSATPTGGYAALRAYLQKGAAEFEPELRDGPRRTGQVVVRLRIGADGKLEQAEAVRKLRPDYDAEAVRLLQEGPSWVPGISAGRRASQSIDVPITFE